MSGILCSAWLVKRFGTRKVIRTTMSFAVLGMLVLSLALWLASAPLFAFGLAIFGASFGSAEVAINVEGAAVEREMNKTVLPMMHGFYSFGTLFGAGVGMAVTGFGLPAAPHILAAALVAGFLSESLISDLSCVGSVLIFCVGLNVAFNAKIRVGNLLPALLVPVLWALF